MKDWKKCTAFLLALVICLGLAACGVGSSEAHRNMKSSLPMITTIQSPRDIVILTGIGAAPSILWSREIPFTGMNLNRSRGMFKWETRMEL